VQYHPASWLRRVALVLAIALPPVVSAQSGDASFSKEKLDQLTAQIALYPDALMSQVLMASTYPADVVEAAKWSRAHADSKGDDAVKMVENEPWDPSVQSLVAFPQVIIMMGEKPEWVRDLGDAFLAQPEDVMDSVQRLRAQAQKAGNLKSNDQMKVSVETPPPPESTTVVSQAAPQQVIVIQPAQPEVVYVPQYNPAVVYGVWPYPAYPPYYIPTPPGYWFSAAVVTGIAWGVGIGVRNALWGGCNWGWGHSSVNINVNRYNNVNVNRRLDVNGSNTNWNHNVQNRKGVAYRGGDATRQNLDRKYQSGNREQFRGRDDSRQRAAQTMQDRGVNVDKAAMGNRAQNVDRSSMQNRAQNVDRGAAQNRAQDVNRGARQERAQNANRDNAFRGADDRNAGQQLDRGNASRQAMQQRPQQAQRAGGGGGAARPQVQRPSGGGGGSAARGGGGGGGARAGGGGGGRKR
jgi:Protein of unknown function (DUF3300)